MKPTQIISILTVSALLTFSANSASAKKEKKAKDLITNGDFSSSKLKMWLVGVTEKYGVDLKPKVKKKCIEFNGIVEMSPKYITLGQYVEIEKGKKYEVSFEVKTSENIKGKFSCNIGRPGYARVKKNFKGYDHIRINLSPANDWSKVTKTFTGLYDTDNNGQEGKKGNDKLKKEWAEKEKGMMLSEAPTWIVFNLGGVKGDVHLRNVTLKEIPNDGKADEVKEDNKEEVQELSKEEKKAARAAKKKAREEKKKNK